MAKLFVRKDPSIPGGFKYFDNNTATWVPLEHGISRFKGDDGQDYIWDASKQGLTPQAGHMDNIEQGINNAYASATRYLADKGLVNPETAINAQVSGLINTRDTLPSTEMTQALQQIAKESEGSSTLGTIGAYTKAIVGNPLSVGVPMLEQSIPTAVPALIGTAAAAAATGGAYLPVQLAAIGAAGYAGSQPINYGSKANELLVSEASKRGISPTDANGLARLSQDPAVMADIQRQATAYSQMVGVGDALAGMLPFGIAAKGALRTAERLAAGLAPEARTLGASALRLAGNVATQAGIGGGAEALGQINQTGSVYDPLSVAGEIGLEGLTGAGEAIGLAHIAKNQYTPNDVQPIVEPTTNPVVEPKSLSDYLAPSDIAKVYEIADKQGIPESTYRSWSPQQVAQYAARLKGSEVLKEGTTNLTNDLRQRFGQDTNTAPGVVPVEGPKSQEQMHKEFAQKAVDYFVSKGKDPSGVTPDTLIKFGARLKEMEDTRSNPSVVLALPKPIQEKLLALPDYTNKPTPTVQEPSSVDVDARREAAAKRGWVNSVSKELRRNYSQLVKENGRKTVEANVGSFSDYVDKKFEENKAAIIEPRDKRAIEVTPTGEAIKPTTPENPVDTSNRPTGAPKQKDLSGFNLGATRRKVTEGERLGTVTPDTLNTQVPERSVYEKALNNVRSAEWFQSLSDEQRAVVERNMYQLDNHSLNDLANRNLNPVVKSYSSNTGESFRTSDDGGTSQEAVSDLAEALTKRKFSRVINLMEEKLKRGMQTFNPENAPTKSFDEHYEETLNKLQARLKSLGLSDKVKIDLVLEAIDPESGERVDGYVNGRSIVLSLLQSDGRNVLTTLNHEVIHSLRNLGLLTEKEWETLEANAPEWRKAYGVDEAYKDQGLSEEELNEEAIAEHFAQTRNIKGAVGTIASKIKSFLQKLSKILNDLGIRTPYDALWLFEQIDNGRMGSRKESVVKSRRDIVRASNNLKDAKKEVTETTSNGITIKSLNKKVETVDTYGKLIGDMSYLAGRNPSLRPLAAAGRQREYIESTLRQQATELAALFVERNGKLTKDEIESATKALVFLNSNKEPLGPDVKEITLKETIPGYAKAGDKVSINPNTMQAIEEYVRQHDRWLNSWCSSTLNHLMEPMFESNPKLASIVSIGANEENLTNILKAYEDHNKTGTPEYNQLAELIDLVNKAKHEVKSQGVYVNRQRMSSTLAYIYDRNQPLSAEEIKTLPTYKEPYKVLATVGVPKTWATGAMPSESVYNSLMQKHGEAIKETNPEADVFIGQPREVVSSDIVDLMSDDSFSTHEKLDLLMNDSIPEDKRRKLLDDLLERSKKRGFAHHFKSNSKGVAGFIHFNNKDNFLANSIASYGSGLSVRVARNATNPLFINAMNGIRSGVQSQRIDPSVLKYAENYMDYINNPPNEFGKLRGLTYHYFLAGANVSSAALQSLQGIHASLPVMTNMFGKTTESAKQLGKEYARIARFTKKSPINWTNPFSSDPFNNFRKMEGLTEDEISMLEQLVDSRDIHAIVNDELASQGIRETVGAGSEVSTRVPKPLIDLGRKLANLSSFMFQRVEIANRVAVALATHRMVKRAVDSNDSVTLERIKKYLNTTEFGDTISPTDAVEVARAAIRLSQFDNSRFNRAELFRGAKAVPLQFLGFQMKFLNLYLDTFKAAFGQDSFDPRKWNINDPIAAKAFGVMFLGLWATSGLIGAVPFGDPLRDAYDKIMGFVTGIDPDKETELREDIASVSNPYMAEAILRGLAPSIANRTGVGIFGGVNTTASIWDMLGPTGGLIATIPQVAERVEQGHTSLAVSLLMPGIIRNFMKANYESNYGIVTQKGNIVPTDYDSMDYLMQVIGFTPADLVRTRTAMLARDRAANSTSVAKERLSDYLTTLRVKEINARRNGDVEAAEEYRKEYQEQLSANRDYNRANRLRPITINQSTIQRRVLEQLKAQRGVLSNRRVPADRRAAVQSEITSAYPTGYIQKGL